MVRKTRVSKNYIRSFKKIDVKFSTWIKKSLNRFWRTSKKLLEGWKIYWRAENTFGPKG